MRMEDPDQRLNREVIEGTGASSSRDDAGSEPRSRPVESSVSAQKPPREQSDDADMGDLETDRRRPKEFAVEERETESQDQRSRWRRKRCVWRPKKNPPSSPDEICCLPTTLREDPSRVTFRREQSPEFAAL